MKANKCIFLLIPLLLTSCNTEQNNNDNGENNNDSNCIIKEKTTINFLSMSDSGYHDYHADHHSIPCANRNLSVTGS